MQELFTYLSFLTEPSFSMLRGPGVTGCDEVRFPVHGCWDGIDVVFHCVEECMSFVM